MIDKIGRRCFEQPVVGIGRGQVVWLECTADWTAFRFKFFDENGISTY